MEDCIFRVYNHLKIDLKENTMYFELNDVQSTL